MLVAAALLAARTLVAQTPELTVDQTEKNIRVLHGLPQSQLAQVMNGMAQALGVGCDHCHVRSTADAETWDLDDKRPKVIAREMIKMVRAVNEANFGGRTAVTCYTCHRGHVQVARTLPLPPHEAAPETAPPALPSAVDLLRRYRAAVTGGREMRTLLLDGSVDRAGGRHATLHVAMAWPDRALLTVTTPRGVTSQRLDRDGGSTTTAAGTTQLTASEVAQAQRSAAIYAAVKVREPAAEMNVSGVEDDAYVAESHPEPAVTKRYFFSTRTSLLTRIQTITDTGFAALCEQIDFSDYREVGGIKLPFVIRTSDASPSNTATRTFTEAKVNVPLDDSLFRAGER